jgi:hypothetical protein
MIRYSQHMTAETHPGPCGIEDAATGEVTEMDELLIVPFIKAAKGYLMVRFHPTNRGLANLLAFEGSKVTILAVLDGQVTTTACIPEYIPQPVIDVPPYVPPKDWNEPPVPLDDLFASGLVKKG